MRKIAFYGKGGIGKSTLTSVSYTHLDVYKRQPKQTAKESVEALKRLKVTPKILTGDQAAIAVSV